MDQARKNAYEIIYDVLEKNAYTNIALNTVLKKSEFDLRERKLVSMLVYGTISYKYTIDRILEKFTKRSINSIDKRVRNILRLGTFQLVFCDSIPDYPACNESVSLAKLVTNKSASGFINAVLRNIARSDNRLELPDKEQKPVEFLSLKYSMSEEIIKKLMVAFNLEQTESFCEACLQKPDLFIRINNFKTQIDIVTDSLSSKGFNVKSVESDLLTLRIEGSAGLFDTDEFKEGLFYVMDESAVLPVMALNPKPGQNILDCCAGPGGKTCVISQMMLNSGYILAMDIHKHKIDLMDKTFKKLGIKNIECKVNDARIFDSNLENTADGVLLDVPCSGLGIIRRKPDIKWNYKANPELYQLQREILYNCSRYVKKGGVLVYSTCTVLPEENELHIKDFLATHKEFRLEKLNFENTVCTEHQEGTWINTYPHINGTDGFFVAKMVKE